VKDAATGGADVWYRLDNAAKIYPAILGKKDTCVYRISATLKETIDPELLQRAVNDCKTRFPSIFVKMRAGFFWYYFEPNEKAPLVREESPRVNQLIDAHRNNDYRFTVFYYRKRVSLECFHALCDGYGAAELLKAILFRYFELAGCAMDSEGRVLTPDQGPDPAELEDSFQKYYSSAAGQSAKVPRAYHIRDKRFPGYSDSGLIVGRVPSDRLVAIARSKGATVTEYLAALLTYSIWAAYGESGAIRRPINLSIPVNLRGFFPSRSLRNFSLFFYTSMAFGPGGATFEEILRKVQSDFVEGKAKDRLQLNLNSNVAMEKLAIIRLCPLAMKNVALRIASTLLGDSPNTITLSNLGTIEIPASMRSRIEDLEAVLSCNSAKANNVAVVSCAGTTAICFARSIYETKIEKSFFGRLADAGAPVEIRSNLIEQYI
jgi:NRPS condensation-like uncharacterized protein